MKKRLYSFLKLVLGIITMIAWILVLYGATLLLVNGTIGTRLEVVLYCISVYWVIVASFIASWMLRR